MSSYESAPIELTAAEVQRLAAMVGLELTEGDLETVAAGLSAHLAATASLFDEVPAETSPAIRFDARW